MNSASTIAEPAGHWDTVIVGAGSAGCVLANRLTASGDRRVLLIEAGPDFPPEAGWPHSITHGDSMELADYFMLFDGRYTDTQAAAFVVRGRLVGGSSAVNGCMFMRGIAEDYDSWGSPQWSYSSVLPSLQRQERDLDFGSGDIHGGEGPIPVRRAPSGSWIPHQAAFHEAVTRMGFQEKADLSRSAGEGVGPIPMNRVDGIRVSAAMGYLDPARSRPNLSISAQTEVLQVLIEAGRATGVLAKRQGRLVRIDADEVILCTSGLMSPHLLIHSGIGPAPILSRLGIPIVTDLPGVGQNLRDHPSIAIETEPPDSFRPGPEDPVYQTMLVLTSRGGDRNDMHVFPFFMLDRLRYDAILQSAHAVGELEFRSAEPDVLPLVRFRYLEDEIDRSRMRDAVHLMLELLEQPSLREIGSRRVEPDDDTLSSNEKLDRWIAESIGSAMHTCGTCRMGSQGDAGAVVDFEGRVQGVHNLRIADLSIAPNVIRAPANATAIMIGERMAELILRGKEHSPVGSSEVRDAGSREGPGN